MEDLLDAARAAGDAADLGGLGDVGRVYEEGMSLENRRGKGVFYTPAEVASKLVSYVVKRGPVADPACGAGVFLLAAGMALASGGVDRKVVVTTQLFGADIDPFAVALTRHALAGWADIEVSEVTGVVEADALVGRRGLWPNISEEGFGAVVGNPPFLGQLRRNTAFTREQREVLRNCYGRLVGAYTDAAWLFLIHGLDLLAPGGRMCLIQPQSVLAASGGALVRSRLLEDARLEALWFDRSGVFSAQVPVCAPVVVREPDSHAKVNLLVDGSVTPAGTAPPPSGGESWGYLAAPLLGIPTVSPVANGCVGDLATVTAGFRQHFYGLVNAVRESDPDQSGRPLATTRLVDPLHFRWGSSPARFSGKRWLRPVVDIKEVTDPEVARWVAERERPKLLVATQTRVLEAMVDETGDVIPVTPLIVVEPQLQEIWRLAAVLCAPPISALAAVASAGAGRSPGRMRVSAGQVAALPLPVDQILWEQGASVAREISKVGARSTKQDWGYLGEIMCCAYEIEPRDVLDWWLSAHPALQGRNN